MSEIRVKTNNLNQIKVRFGDENKIKVIPSIGAETLGALNDVDTSNLDNGYTLIYDINNGKWTATNSVTTTINNPIYVVGDNATNRTVMVTVVSGTQLTLDSVAGISTSDVVTGINIPPNTTISGINGGTKVITLSNSITGTINSASQITISQGIDTNDDRGIAFKYVSSGIGTQAIVKTGFFGYVDSTSRWTYVPDAGIGGNVVTGTKGFLDIKGIYYQAGDFSTNGINYFDTNGLMKSTVAPGAGINTSNYILTTDASGVPTWTDTIDGGTF